MILSARWWLPACALAVLAGCAAEKEPPPEMLPVREFEQFATGAAQRDRLCGRANADPVIDLFCLGERPQIGSFVELRDALGLAGRPSYGTYQGFALTGHSTSLVSRSVSAINPRAIFVRPEHEEEDRVQELLALAFARGEQFSEIVTRDRVDGEISFYLVTFEQECNASAQGCAPGDLFTEAAEVGWRDVNVYGEEDLANTPFDCLTCHQPDGPGTPKFLRMQEFEPPWNHWFYKLSEGGSALIGDYLAAKGDELFVGLSSDDVALNSEPGLLSSTLFFANPFDQPNEFVSTEIEPEVKDSAAALGGHQPADNSVPGQSEAWNRLYERSKRGQAISVPYHDVKITDPGKLAMMTQAYTDYREGRLPREELPDLRDVRPDDPIQLAHMGVETEPGMDGEQVLLQACAQCHNARLDQTLSRARFTVELDTLDRAEKSRAITRISLPEGDPRVMPPPLARRLSEEGRARLIELLER